MNADKHAQAQELARRLREWPVGGRKNTPAADCHEAAAMIDALLREWPEAGEPAATVVSDGMGNRAMIDRHVDLPVGTPLYASTLPRAPGFSETELKLAVKVASGLGDWQDARLIARALLRESGK